jgi:hypothetical protein
LVNSKFKNNFKNLYYIRHKPVRWHGKDHTHVIASIVEDEKGALFANYEFNRFIKNYLFQNDTGNLIIRIECMKCLVEDRPEIRLLLPQDMFYQVAEYGDLKADSNLLLPITDLNSFVEEVENIWGVSVKAADLPIARSEIS